MNETVTAPFDSTEMQRSEGGESWAKLETGKVRIRQANNTQLMRIFFEKRTRACMGESVWLSEMERNRWDFIVEHKFTSNHPQPKKKKGVL
jgi:hypothetical protein